MGNLSHWIDETIPKAACELLTREGVDADEFAEWLGPALGRYRSEIHIRDNMPSLSDQAKALRSLRAHAGKTAEALRDLPPHARAVLSTNALRVSRPDLLKRLDDDLRIATTLIAATVSGAAKKEQRGRKQTVTRDILLAHCVKRLRSGGIKAGDSLPIAAALLRACRVTVPADHDRIKRAVARGRKKDSTSR